VDRKPAKRTKGVFVACRVTEEQAHKFKIACAVEKTTIQAVLEKAILDFIETKKPE
jgi:hypothetical protein